MPEDKLKIIYKYNKPYGIRDSGGFLFFFTDISKYEGQEERYREEIENQYKLADFLLKALAQEKEPKKPDIRILYEGMVPKKKNNKKQLNEQEVIQLIDGICLGWENSPQTLEQAKLRLDEIYIVAHGYRKSSCWYVHKDWREKAVKLLKEYKKMGMC